jgi:predicted 3-demethylubiquinone-9 3-methyltransferase (glyoxalase superfamily)
MLFTGPQAGKAEEAMKLYTSLFDRSGIMSVMRYEKGEPGPEGWIKHARFLIHNQVFIAFDSSMPHGFSFNEGISFVVECETQAEIDHFWDNFTREGEESMCGWLKDKFGFSWQIIPAVLSKLMSNPATAQKTLAAFLQMKKFDIAALENAAKRQFA